MRIYIMVDMEGISGILRDKQVSPGTPEYAKTQRYMTWDVNACVEGCFKGGAKTVTVRDCHSNGDNILWEEVDNRARLIQQGWEAPVRMPLVDKHDAVILLGYHPMAGTMHGILEHTMTSVQWQNFWMNGVKTGEIGIDMGIASDHGKPVIMVSGSEMACAEARKFVGNIKVAPVKKDLDVFGGMLLSKEAAHNVIRTAATEAVTAAIKGIIKPVRVKHPVRMRLERVSRSRIPEVRPGVKVINSRTYEVTGKDVESALRLIS
jgi:D-amino peptidase